MNVIVALIGSTISFLFTLVLADFHREILNLTKVYCWQERVLPIALDLYTHIVEGYTSDFS